MIYLNFTLIDLISTLSLPHFYLDLWRAAELSKVSVIFCGEAHWSLGSGDLHHEKKEAKNDDDGDGDGDVID